MRHGQSEWNKANLFTGWADVDLTEEGTKQATEAGKLIKEAGIEFDVAFTSVLKRAIKQLTLLLKLLTLGSVEKSWRLNERHYGGLTGQTVSCRKWGDECSSGVVHTMYCHQLWLKTINTQHTLTAVTLTLMTSCSRCRKLEVTLERALPFWEDKIAPALKDGKNVFVGAHGNSIRALVKHIKQLSDDEIMDAEILTSHLVFEFDEKLNVTNEYFGK